MDLVELRPEGESSALSLTLHANEHRTRHLKVHSLLCGRRCSSLTVRLHDEGLGAVDHHCVYVVLLNHSR